MFNLLRLFTAKTEKELTMVAKTKFWPLNCSIIERPKRMLCGQNVVRRLETVGAQ